MDYFKSKDGKFRTWIGTLTHVNRIQEKEELVERIFNP